MFRGETLVLLEDNFEAQKLAVTWPNIGLLFEGLSIEELDDDTARAWAKAADVDIDDVSSQGPLLWNNAMIGPKGEIAREVAGYISTRVVESVKRPARSRNRSR